MNGVVFKAPDGRMVPEECRPMGSSQKIPEWYEKVPAEYEPGNVAGTTVKFCRPFSDALHAGFVIPATKNVEVEVDENGEVTTSSTDAIETFGITVNHGMSKPETSVPNASNPKPHVLIKNRWRIRTPPGYSLLVTKPMNRRFSGIEPFSMLIGADKYDGRIDIPAAVTAESASLSVGDPLVQVIPLKRSDLIDFEIRRVSDAPELHDRARKVKRQLAARKDLYRNVYWQQKPRTRVITDEPADSNTAGESDVDLRIDEESNGVNSTLLLIDDIDYGVIPEPDYTERFAPDWLSGCGPEALPEKYKAWIAEACALGLVDTVVADMVVERDGPVSTASSLYDGDIFSSTPPEKIGDDFEFVSRGIAQVSTGTTFVQPDGFSTLVTEPLNHFQRKFKCFSGIVDHDVYPDTATTPGILISDKEQFTLNEGEPLFQAIPIRRESILERGVIVE